MENNTVSKLLSALNTSGLNHQIEADIKPIGEQSYTGQRMQIRLSNRTLSIIDTRKRVTLASCDSCDDLKVSQLVLEAINQDNGGRLWM